MTPMVSLTPMWVLHALASVLKEWTLRKNQEEHSLLNKL